MLSSIIHAPTVRPLLRTLLVIALAAVILGSLNAAVIGQPTAPRAVCGGTVYRDYNASGIRTDRIKPGVPSVSVQAVYAGGSVATTTDSNGVYTLTVPDNTNFRIEFGPLLDPFKSGPYGSQSSTSVTFVNSASCSNVDFGIDVPGQFCQDNPTLATNCYVEGHQLTSTLPVLVSFPYSGGGATLPAGAQPTPTEEAMASQIGTTWGLAFQHSSNSLFAAAFMKRHTGFGPGGTGAIYRIDTSVPFGTPGKTSLFLDLNTLFPGSTGADPHPAGTVFFNDQNSWDPVGKISLGDIDISEDDQTLWAMSLNDRQLYQIPVGSPPVAPLAGSISRFPVPSPTDCPVPATNLRSFALAVHDGLVYVGMVCTAESTQLRTDLRAYVYSFAPGPNTFTQVLNFPLNYPRTCAVQGCAGVAGGNGNAGWLPWVNVFTVIPTIYSPSPDNLYIYPQPLLTDIVFDDGNMILGLRDRFGDQMGYLQGSTNPADPNLYGGVSAGDILRACGNPASGWTLESNGTCGGITTGGAGNGQGPGGGEYYYQENFVPDHTEVSIGGLAQVPGLPDVVETIYDPFVIYDGGTIWLNNSTGITAGQRTKGYEVFALVPPPVTFGKAAGLGDLEAFCDAAPIEIGNRVWLNQVRDGSQNPETATGVITPELPIAGVTMHLYDMTGTLIATTTTNAQGEYYFNNSNVPGGVKAFLTYTIRLDNLADYISGTLPGPLAGLTATLSLQGLDRALDSNGVLGPTGFPETTLRTGNYGDNDHTFDFGFFRIPTAVTLLYFRVDGVSERQVRLAWASAAEIDNFGYNLYRAPVNDFARASPIHFEPSSIKGGGTGATYSYTDIAPSDGTWWYWLADVDTHGRETTRAQVSVRVGLDAALPNRIYLPMVHR